MIERDVDPTGGGTYTEITRYVWDGDNIVMAFNGSNALTARYLNGPNTSAYDEFYTTLAEEDVTTTASQGVVTWALVDNQDSVRDVIDSNGNVIDHIVYNSNGQTAYESSPSVSRLLGWQGGYVDAATGQEEFGERWYNSTEAVWDSEDPIGFAGGSMNLTESRANDPTNTVDENGELGLAAGRVPPCSGPDVLPFASLRLCVRPVSHAEEAHAKSQKRKGKIGRAGVDNSGSPNMPHVVLTSVYAAAGNRASLAATIYNGTTPTPDFVNNYSYDELSRLIDITERRQQRGDQAGLLHARPDRRGDGHLSLGQHHSRGADD
ncbi:MAG: RHS repeat-associated core domain-containing protein, partial [Pirellulales bacterium]